MYVQKYICVPELVNRLIILIMETRAFSLTEIRNSLNISQCVCAMRTIVNYCAECVCDVA